MMDHEHPICCSVDIELDAVYPQRERVGKRREGVFPKSTGGPAMGDDLRESRTVSMRLGHACQPVLLRRSGQIGAVSAIRVGINTSALRSSNIPNV